MPPEHSHKFNGFEYKVDSDQTEINDVLKIKSTENSKIPNHLYKYYGIHRVYNKFSIDAFVNHYLFASHPWHFNDPFDCNRELISFHNAPLDSIIELNNNMFDPKEIERFYNSKNPKDKAALEDIMKKIIFYMLYMTVGITSLTSKRDSMEMWSYYTNHRGLVLKFNLEKLKKNFWGPFPINYTNTFEPIDYTILGNSSMLYQSNIKAKCWSHEKEWRLLFHGEKPMKIPYHDMPNAAGRSFYYNPEAIEEVILGYNFFELSEILFDESDQNNTTVRLKTNHKVKRLVLKTILDRGYKTSMVALKKSTSYDLIIKNINLTKLSTKKYHIEYLS